MAISSINSSASYVSQLLQTQQTSNTQNTQDVNRPQRPEHHGKKPPFGDAIAQALSQAGVTATQGDSNLDAFMKNLFDTLRSQGALTQTTDQTDGTTASVDGKHKPHGGGKGAFEQDLASLLQKVSSGDTSDPAIAQLQESFQALVGSNSTTTLKDFLTSLQSSIKNASSSSGNVINTTA